MENTTFHLSLNVTDLEKACDFYGELLGAKQGRSTETWVDFNFYGHQLSLHIGEPLCSKPTGEVDGIAVPIPHFGVILAYNTWKALAQKLTDAKIEFIIPPTQRFKKMPGEQYTMFLTDPFGNPIEFKSFLDKNEIFNT